MLPVIKEKIKFDHINDFYFFYGIEDKMVEIIKNVI